MVASACRSSADAAFPRSARSVSRVLIVSVGAGLLVGITGELRGTGVDASPLTLESSAVRLTWEKAPEGWQLTKTLLLNASGENPYGVPSGEYTIIYAAESPSTEAVEIKTRNYPTGFPEPIYRGVAQSWKEATSPVALNLAGDARRFFPQQAAGTEDGRLIFNQETDLGVLSSEWRMDARYPSDVVVKMTFTARVPGFFSLATPTLATVAPNDLAWATVPGCFAGAEIEPDLVRSLGYGQGLPARPVLARERTASSLTAITTAKNGVTLAVVASPGVAADPWAADRDSRQAWQLGLSHMNRRGQFVGTLYHPVLGQQGSRLLPGESVTFDFRFSLRDDGWLGALRHVAYNVYDLNGFLSMKRPTRSLTDRLNRMRSYVTNDKTSLWRVQEFNGRMIGAQAYLGTVAGSDPAKKDAMKNSDYGAMWMLARMTGDLKLVNDRLPAARAFKLEQQDAGPGFFQGAAIGQYYLAESRRFTEEFGNYVEPVALTYYTCCDLGNILLFSPEDEELRGCLRLGADRLLAWQHSDGHWDVAYDRDSARPLFGDLADFRPTFYGLLVAYRILGDAAYLDAARRGADWLVAHAVLPRKFLGVCGDSRFVPDFATAQVAEALLELHEATGEPRYREAAISLTEFYLTSIYTHPMATRQMKNVRGTAREDWEINQVGLGYEHGGTLGSTNRYGPILLASHAGFFIRMHRLTGEPLFRDLARAGALARDAFVDPATSVASYYWTRMNEGPGLFPHHAWWQIGWITDYLVAEAELRSSGAIFFPHGFFTPKVGPHVSHGFAQGKVFGNEAKLDWGGWSVDLPEVDYIAAQAKGNGARKFIVLLNESGNTVTARVSSSDTAFVARKAALLGPGGEESELPASGPWRVSLSGYGFAVLAVDP